MAQWLRLGGNVAHYLTRRYVLWAKSRLPGMKIKYSFLAILFLVGCSSDPNVKYAKSVETGGQLCFIENNKFQVGNKWEPNFFNSEALRELHDLP